MRFLILTFISYFCFAANLSSIRAEDGIETYIGPDGKLIALSKDMLHYFKNFEEYNQDNIKAYEDLFRFIRSPENHEGAEIDAFIAEKAKEDVLIYFALGCFYSNKMQELLKPASLKDEREAFKYLMPRPEEIDYQKAEKYFLKFLELSKNTHEKLLVHLSLSYLYGNKETPLYSTKKEFLHLKKSAELGNSDAQFQLGNKYLNGQNIPKNIKKAEYWIVKAADENDNMYALTYITFLYHSENSKQADFPKDHKKVIYYGEKLIKLFGNYSVHGIIGDVYEFGGHGVEKNPEKAFYHMEKCAEMAQKSVCQKILGLYYKNGFGVIRDTEKARYYLNLAAKKGNEEAGAILSGMAQEKTAR